MPYLLLSTTNVSTSMATYTPDGAGEDLPSVLILKKDGARLRLTPEGRKRYLDSSLSAGSICSAFIPPGWAAGKVLRLTDFYGLSASDRYTIMACRPDFSTLPTPPGSPNVMVSNTVVFDNRRLGANSGASNAAQAVAGEHAKPQPKDEWDRFAKLAGNPIERCVLYAMVSPTAHNGSTLIVSLRRVEIGDDRYHFRLDSGYYQTDYRVLVRGPHGNNLPVIHDADFQNSLDHRRVASLEPLVPASAVGTWIPLAKWFDMKEPGEYSVLVVLPDRNDKSRAWVAEPIKVRVGAKPPSLFAAEPNGTEASALSSPQPMSKRVVLVIHGGAGVLSEEEMKAEGLTRHVFEQALARSLAAGYSKLGQKNCTSVDAVEAAVRVMEDCDLFNAGLGAAFNSDGRVELDAAIMEGTMIGRGEGKQDPRKRAGAVAAVTHVKNPISAARAVMEMEGSRHVLLVGDGAERFALGDANRAKYHIEAVSNLYFWTDRRLRQIRGEFQRNAGDAAGIRYQPCLVPPQKQP